jgi:TonB family protein
MPLPDYPEWARRNRWSGKVVVEAIANTEGKVVAAQVSEGPGVFYQPALLAARSSIHQPRTACGEPIFFRWRITYLFSI